ncbi:MAG: hypothetical protein AAF821_03390 [Cyanobacteria bacterium P01_D01_bin.156]
MSTSNTRSFRADHLPTIEQILGVAIFDTQGFPIEYFGTTDDEDTSWIQLAFQSLGLQQLLSAEMNLPSLDHAVIRTKSGNIVVLPTGQGFVVLLLKRSLPQESPTINSAWITWTCDFVETVVKTDSRFRAL